ncbi:MAG: hypothetical protein ACKPH1_04510 [Microcystis panniformis]
MGIFANIPQLNPPERHRTLTQSLHQCAWCVPPKSIGGAVRATLGNAPYSDSDLIPPERHRTLTHSFNKCAWCVPQKSIGGAVGATLGNAPYKIGVLLRSAFGIALSQYSTLQQSLQPYLGVLPSAFGIAF